MQFARSGSTALVCLRWPIEEQVCLVGDRTKPDKLSQEMFCWVFKSDEAIHDCLCSGTCWLPSSLKSIIIILVGGEKSAIVLTFPLLCSAGGGGGELAEEGETYMCLLTNSFG